MQSRPWPGHRCTYTRTAPRRSVTRLQLACVILLNESGTTELHPPIATSYGADRPHRGQAYIARPERPINPPKDSCDRDITQPPLRVPAQHGSSGVLGLGRGKQDWMTRVHRIAADWKPPRTPISTSLTPPVGTPSKTLCRSHRGSRTNPARCPLDCSRTTQRGEGKRYCHSKPGTEHSCPPCVNAVYGHSGVGTLRATGTRPDERPALATARTPRRRGHAVRTATLAGRHPDRGGLSDARAVNHAGSDGLSRPRGVQTLSTDAAVDRLGDRPPLSPSRRRGTRQRWRRR